MDCTTYHACLGVQRGCSLSHMGSLYRKYGQGCVYAVPRESRNGVLGQNCGGQCASIPLS